MYVLTHALAPVVLCATVDAVCLERTGSRLLRGRHYLAIGLAGALPDLLSPHLSLAARYSSWSHTAWFLLLFVPVALLLSRLFPERRALLATLMILACAFHLFCDAIAGGIAWGYPFTTETIGRSLVPATLWWKLDVACVALTAGLGSWLRRRDRLLLDRTTSALAARS